MLFAYDPDGVDLYRKSQYAAAAQEFRVAQGLMPDSPKLAYNLARSLERAGEIDAAISAYDRYLTLAPDAADAADVRQVIETLRKMAYRGEPEPGEQSAEASPPVEPTEGPRAAVSSPFPWHAVTLGVAVVAAGGAVWAGVEARSAADEAVEATGPDPYDEARGRAGTWASTATGLWIGAGMAAVGSGLLWFLRPGDDSVTAASVAPLACPGIGVQVSNSF